MSILLQHATIIVPATGSDEFSILRDHSLLIEDSKISHIAAQIDPPSETTEVIDCTGKIVSPGFVDTHHHLWGTQLKGRHANDTMLDFMFKGVLQSSNFTANDVFWGQLGGCLEALDAGTTTVVDHAHAIYSPEHGSNALSATVSSGIRSVFCYAPVSRVTGWQPLAFDWEMLPDWLVNQLEELARAGPYGEGRVNIGLGFDALYIPKESVVSLFERARAAGVKLITMHYARGPIFGQFSVVDTLSSYGLLGPDLLFANAIGASASDAEIMAKEGIAISSTPESELQMGLGKPVWNRDDLKTLSSLGSDSQTVNSTDLLTQMRIALQTERGRNNEALLDQGKAPKKLSVTAADVFRLATIQGARAIRLQDRIGSLEQGKQADIVIFGTQSPAMTCAAEHDPIAAIVLHASVRDIETVIVDGHIRKRDGRLTALAVDEAIAGIGKSNVEWKDVAAQLLRTRERINAGTEKIDYEAAAQAFMAITGIDSNNLV
ncbi:uncharacterized protein TRUGW13939_04218 [Talaromyces rugulosus]|uniref:Amidohydrolase-related domain-containing protein n=1 Tax=Talaromyces rugulosus TaxID=121627 RepID=A0A7H8QT06_TALRU|nr:uncharacterized protein TRUGW13939_04218 [Talaromyces rugulosus]QKX57110.1 hypothetical protein TRUGW13939_04218 [Talaromyces rugulosus]